MKKQKTIKKIVALILAIAIVCTGRGLSILAEEKAAAKKAKQVTVQEEKKKKVSVVRELEDMRTENSNTYLLSNGQKRLDLYSEDIRYKENEKWVEYNTTITNATKKEKTKLDGMVDDFSDYKYVNNTGNIAKYFSKSLGENKGVITTKGDYAISLIPDVEQLYNSEIKDNEVVYTSDESNIKYQYISLRNGFKENIILNEMPENNCFEYQLKLNGLTATIDKKTGRVLLKDKKKIKAYLDRPNLIDAEGNENCENVRYKLNNDKLLIEVDESYLKNENTKYPVTIDPFAVWTSVGIKSAIVSSFIYVSDENLQTDIFGVHNKCLNTIPYTGEEEERAYIKFDLENAYIGTGNSFDNKFIENATLRVIEYTDEYCNAYTHTPAIIDIRSPKTSWNENTITWNNQPELEDTVWGSFQSVCEDGIEHLVDITKWAQAIADGKINNTGIVLMAREAGTGADVYGSSFNYGGTTPDGHGYAYNMYVSIYYRDIESYDETVTIDAEYGEEDNKFRIKLEKNGLDEKNQNEDDNVTITGYTVYRRLADEDEFEGIKNGEQISDSVEISMEDIQTSVDIRVCLAYSDGTAVPSNIVTLEKSESAEEAETEEGGEEETQGENTSSSVTYTPTTIDTDGDGLEDGYEIWDFKTLWNTETSDSTEENPIYEQDSDEDGLPDGYEVFTLGTDPAVANASGTDSDNDGLTDIQEYNRGTDPWLRDSDFDNTSDQGDSTPRKTNGHTRQTVAAAANVHIGMYDREYSETEEGVTYTYIKNIYRGEIKKTAIDYGDSTLNKTMKYFYDAKGNNTAIVEQYDETYDPNHTQTICITYTYDADNNVTFICDQWTKYTMTYSGNNMTSLKVGNQELIQYADTELVNNAGENDDISNLSVGDVINRNQNITTHGNGQSIKTVTTTYKVAENDTTSVATEVKIYYGNATQESYKTTYNIDGSVLSLTDYTQDADNPTIYTYTYTDNTTSVSRSDGFTKSVQTSEDEDTGASTTSTSYGFTDVKGNHQTYTSSVTASIDEENNSNILLSTLYNNDTYRISTNEEDETQVTREKLHSDLYDRNILKTTQTINSNTSTSYAIDIYAEDKDIDYTYDLTGNITEIKIGNDTKYRYSYDAHGRLTNEKDYVDKKQYIYNYNETGNIQGKTSYNLDNDGNRITSSAHTVYSEYNNTQWPDQLTTYNNQTITYDNSGNPLNYIHGMQFTWDRGRQLTNILLTNENNDETDDKNIVFRYNDSGLRTYKDTEDTTTVYEWDDTNLIRETVTYKATNKTYDIWYFYDGSGNVIGYEYSYINEQNQKSRTRIYYEKDLQGNIIGLLDARGAEITTYAYDAWGNITGTVCYEGYETAYNLNHITYRSYYRDDETGFYYLQSRYYDPEICRFVNADDVACLSLNEFIISKDNLFCYCNSNPIINTDPSGKGIVVLAAVIGITCIALVGCAKKTYVPQYNSGADKITKETSNYNCYAYALGKKKWACVGEFSGKIVMDMKIDKIVDGTKKDLKKLGYKTKTVKSDYNPKKGETMIAIRSGKRDYHFMKKTTGGKWKHKPGNKAILTLKGNPGDYSVWYAEYFDGKWNINKSYKYDSKIYYIVYYK